MTDPVTPEDAIERIEIALSWVPPRHFDEANAALRSLAAQLEAAQKVIEAARKPYTKSNGAALIDALAAYDEQVKS